MSGVQRSFFSVPGVDLHGAVDLVPSGRVIISFDFEGRTDRFRLAAEELAGKGFASFARVGAQGNVKKSTTFGPRAARAVVNYVIQHPGAFAGTTSKLLEIYLIGTSSAASAVAAIASEFEQVSKILLISPEPKPDWQVMDRISEFAGDVTILGGASSGQSSLDSQLELETCADVARSCRSAVTPGIDQRAISLAPLWAFFSAEPVIPDSWQSPTEERDVVNPPTDRTRIAQLKVKLSEYESPAAPVTNLEKKLWATSQLLRGESVSHRDLSSTFYRDAPKDIEEVLSVLAIQCSADPRKLDEADSLTHPSGIGYLAQFFPGPNGSSFTLSLVLRVRPGSFQPIEAVPIPPDSGDLHSDAPQAAKLLFGHYQGPGVAMAPLSDSALSDVTDKFVRGGTWFLPLTYLENLVSGVESPDSSRVDQAEFESLTA